MKNYFAENQELINAKSINGNPEILKQLDKINILNKRYQLTPGTETDFNNASSFLKFAITKNSKEIDKAETSGSSLFGNLLLKYFNSYLSNNEIVSLVSFIKNYNKAIESEYKQEEINYPKIYKNMFGLDTQYLQFKKSSLADKTYNKFFNDFFKNGYDLSDSIKNNLSSLLTLYLISKEFGLSNPNEILPNTASSNYHLVFIKNPNVSTHNIQMSLDNIFYENNPYTFTVGTMSDLKLGYIESLNNNVEIIYNGITKKTRIMDILNDKSDTILAEKVFRMVNSDNIIKMSDANKIDITIKYKNESLAMSIDFSIIKIKNNEQGQLTIIEKNIYSFLTDQDILDKVNAVQAFTKYEYDLMLNTFKIYLHLIEPNITISSVDNEKIANLEKRSANSIETYYALKNINVVPMSLIVYVEHGTELAIALGYGDKNTDFFIQIDIIYKELNSYIRDLDFSDMQNKIVAKYIIEKSSSDQSNKTILTNELYDKVYNYDYVNSIYNDKSISTLFINTYTNNFVIRNSVANDIISYLAGSIINFGDTEEDKEDIQTILLLYKECRDHFYKVLFNDSFLFEDGYDLYVLLFIKAETIERFVSSRLDNFLDINHFTKEDCRNFLISYGLKALSDQVDNNDFINSLAYKKRIIANYNNIMSKKGSRAVIDEFFKIFNYDQNQIEIYKYLIFQEPNEPQKAEVKTLTKSKKAKAAAAPIEEPIITPEKNVKFISVPYYSKNILFNLNESTKKNNTINYNEFIKNDPYWTSEMLSEKQVAQEFTSPVNTKYLGVDLKRDLLYNTVASKYVLSLNDYLYDKLKIDSKSVYKNIIIKLEDTEVDLEFLYLMLRGLFSTYVYYNEKLFVEPGITNNKYLGINANAAIPDNIKTILETNYFTATLASNDKINYTTSAENKIYFYNKMSNATPYSINNYDYNNLFADSLASISTIPYTNFPCLLLDKNKVYNNDSKEQFVDQTKYKNFINMSKDIQSNDKEFISSFNILENAFISISPIALLNNNAITFDKTKFLYYFNKYKNKSYPNENSFISNTEKEIKELSLKDFYQNLYTDILNFPLEYLFTDYSLLPDTRFNHADKELLDQIFNSFYITDSPIIPIENSKNSAFDNPIFKEKLIASCNKKSSDDQTQTTCDALLKKLLTDIVATGDNYNYFTDNIEAHAKACYEQIINLNNILNQLVEGLEQMKIHLETSESGNNFLDFIVTSISFFISYTALLYKANLIMNVDSKTEKAIITTSITDSITNTVSDYMYYDESVNIIEKNKNTSEV